MAFHEFDLCVIGAGPGAYPAAIRAARQGLKTAIVEKAFPGGTCLNCGCIPTKALIASAELYHKIVNSQVMGISIDGTARPDWTVMQSRKENLVGTLRSNISALLKGAGAVAFNGTASFRSANEITVALASGETDEIKAKNFLVCTGSLPAKPGFIPSHPRILDSTSLLAIDKIPLSLTILGGGVIGCEFASLFAALGTSVTIVEMQPNILPLLDKELARYQAMQFKKAGIKIITGQALSDIVADDDSVSAKAGEEIIKSEYLLVSIGRRPATEGLALEAPGIKTDAKGWIKIDEYCRTSVPNIYAAGDICGSWQLAHAATAMGLCALDNIQGKNKEFDSSCIPSCIFTNPEAASVGLTEEQCIEKNLPYKVGKFPFIALGKAHAADETAGFCKIISDSEDGIVLGVHISGAHSADIISEAALAVNCRLTVEQIGHTIHPHPTMGEAMMEAAHAVEGESVHLAPPRKRPERK